MLCIIIYIHLRGPVSKLQAMKSWEVVHRTKVNSKVYIVSNSKSLMIRMHEKIGSLTWFVGDHCFKETQSTEFSDFYGFRTDPDKYFKASSFV